MKGWGSHHRARLYSTFVRIKPSFRSSLDMHGYTITEVLIFLAVTTAIFVMIAGSISGRQRGTEFSTAAREMEARVQDIANDITTGFYNNSGNITCRVVAGNPVISPGSAAQGTNNDCILVGRAAHFVNSAFPQGDRYTAYSVAGARQVDAWLVGPRDVENYTEARPRAIVDTMETHQMPTGLRITSMYIEGGGRINGIGFYTTFNVASGNPTSLTVNLVPLVGTDAGAMVGRINNVTTYNAGNLNPSQGVVLCMDGDGTNQHALLRIGSSNSRLTTDLIIGGNTCASRGYPA